MKRWRCIIYAAIGNIPYSEFSFPFIRRPALPLSALICLACACASVPKPPNPDPKGFILVSPDPARLVSGTLDYAYRIRSVISLAPEAPAGLSVPPGAQGEISWGLLPVGPSRRPLVCMAEEGPSGPIRIRVDADLDGDLAEEPVEEWRPLARPVWHLFRDIALAGPPAPGQPPPVLRMQFTLSAQSLLDGRARCVFTQCFASWRGMASLGGKQAAAAVFPPAETLETPMDATRLALDLDGDGRLEDAADSAEHMHSSEVIPFDNKAWRLKRLDPAAGIVEFETVPGPAPFRPPLRIGDPVPGFQARTAGGEPFDLQALQGRVILLQFWSARAPGYVQEIPALSRLLELYEPQGLSIVRLNLDRSESAEPRNAPLLGTPWTELAGTGGADDPLRQLFRVWDLPWSLLIGRDGLIRAKNLTGAALEQEVERLAGSLAP